MVYAYSMNILAELLSSKIRAEIFRILFGTRDESLHMREIERRTGFTMGTVQHELKKLHRLDLIKKNRDGNRLYYEANKNHPLYSEIKKIVLKTVGLVDVLRQISALTSRLVDQIGREINPHVLTVAEFKMRLDKREHFISHVMNEKKLFVIGNEQDLNFLGK